MLCAKNTATNNINQLLIVRQHNYFFSMTYMGYKIERARNQWGKLGWGVYVEEHTQYKQPFWTMTFWAETQEEAKQGCRSHFGRI